MNNSSGPLAVVEKNLDLYLVQKAPKLPTPWKELIVKITPWVTLVLAFLSLAAIPILLAALGLGTFFLPYSAVSGGFGVGILGIIVPIVSIISLVLYIMAAPGLFKRARKGWYFLFLSALVGIVGDVLSFNLISIVAAVIGLYFLFQIREYYK